MRRMTFALFLLTIHFAWAESTLDHLNKLKKKYPYGLLTNDFGILSESDLAINTCYGMVDPVSSGNGAYPYWQCFETKNTKFECARGDYDNEEKSMMTIMAIVVEQGQHSDEYLSPRAIRMADCQYFKHEWMRTTKKETHVCISGQEMTYKKQTLKGTKSFWIFDKFKTSKSCVPYFENGCDLRAQIKDGCVLSKK